MLPENMSDSAAVKQKIDGSRALRVTIDQVYGSQHRHNVARRTQSRAKSCRDSYGASVHEP